LTVLELPDFQIVLILFIIVIDFFVFIVGLLM